MAYFMAHLSQILVRRWVDKRGSQLPQSQRQIIAYIRQGIRCIEVHVVG